MRSILEYAAIVWCPYLNRDKERIEKVQRHFTKMVEGMVKLNYTERLMKLNLPNFGI